MIFVGQSLLVSRHLSFKASPLYVSSIYRMCVCTCLLLILTNGVGRVSPFHATTHPQLLPSFLESWLSFSRPMRLPHASTLCSRKVGYCRVLSKPRSTQSGSEPIRPYPCADAGNKLFGPRGHRESPHFLAYPQTRRRLFPSILLDLYYRTRAPCCQEPTRLRSGHKLEDPTNIEVPSVRKPTYPSWMSCLFFIVY